jgi:MFS family permease
VTRWPGVLCIVAAGIAAAAQVGKLSPAIEALQAELGLTLVASGWMVSVIALFSAALGVAAGSLIGPFDPRSVLRWALALCTLASACGAAAPGAALLLVSRAIEGAGYLVITVTAPVLIAMNTDDRDRPLALTLWGCFVPLGLASMNLAGPWIIERWSWRGLFLVNAALLTVTLGAQAAVQLRAAEPPAATERTQRSVVATILEEHWRIYRHRPAVLLACIFSLFVVLHVGFLALLPVFLASQVGVSATTAGAIAALAAVSYIPGALVAGVLLRLRARGSVMAFSGFIVMAGAALWVFRDGAPVQEVTAASVVLSAAAGVVGSVCFAGVPGCAPSPGTLRLVNGLFAQLGSLGTLIGIPFIVLLATRSGWDSVPVLFVAGAVAGPLCTLPIAKRLSPGP